MYSQVAVSDFMILEGRGEIWRDSGSEVSIIKLLDRYWLRVQSA